MKRVKPQPLSSPICPVLLEKIVTNLFPQLPELQIGDLNGGTNTTDNTGRAEDYVLKTGKQEGPWTGWHPEHCLKKGNKYSTGYVSSHVQQIPTRRLLKCQLMPNIGGPKPRRRALLATVVKYILTYGIAIWSSALQLQKCQRRIYPVGR